MIDQAVGKSRLAVVDMGDNRKLRILDWSVVMGAV